jgi:hypothetical protein
MQMAAVGLKVQYRLQVMAQRLRQGKTMLGLAVTLWILSITVLFNTSAPAQLAPALQGQQQQLQQQKTQIQQERQRIQNLEKSAQQHLTGLRKNIQATPEQTQATTDSRAVLAGRCCWPAAASTIFWIGAISWGVC